MGKGRADGGGVKAARDVWKYKTPQGPTSIGNKRVGLGGDNHGNCGAQTPYYPRVGSGGPGLGGRNLGKGTNRRG